MIRTSKPDAAKGRAKLTLAQALGHAIRRLRSAHGQSQEDFADAIGLHRTAMSTLERGRADVKLSSMEAIARGLKIPVSQLLREAEREAEREHSTA